MRNNVKDVEKEKRVDGMPPLREQGWDREAGAISSGQAEAGPMCTHAVRVTGRTEKELK